MRTNKSPWLHNFNYDRTNHELLGMQKSEVAILGGGISGIMTAYFTLKMTGKKVVVIDKDRIAHGATGHNAGFVVPAFEKSFAEIVTEYGLDTARSGQKELDDAMTVLQDIYKEIGLGELKERKNYVTFMHADDFLRSINDTLQKYGELTKKYYVLESSELAYNLPKNLKDKIVSIDEESMRTILNIKNAHNYIGIKEDTMFITNSAVFVEKLAKYLLEKYHDRFTIYENSNVHSIRLLQNGECVLDGIKGVCISDKVILCTNGFENFDVYGPNGLDLDKKIHYQISGVIGYMIGTFTQDKHGEDVGQVFKEVEQVPLLSPKEAKPYIYLTKRHFDMGVEDGELVAIGGPEVYLHDRRIYKKDHEVDENIYKELETFQKKVIGINNEPTFKWHGLMGYTKNGIRIVGRDPKFWDLYYNLGCNGIGIVPSIAGGLRVARLLAGEILPKSIFDPR